MRGGREFVLCRPLRRKKTQVVAYAAYCSTMQHVAVKISTPCRALVRDATCSVNAA